MELGALPEHRASVWEEARKRWRCQELYSNLYFLRLGSISLSQEDFDLFCLLVN
jgi:hypothetical protein